MSGKRNVSAGIDFIEYATKGRSWMKEVPQAIFLHLRPVLDEEEQRQVSIMEGENTRSNPHSLLGPRAITRSGFLFSFTGLIKREGVTDPVSCYSGVKFASPDHCRVQPGMRVKLEMAVTYSLLYLLWTIRHGLIPQGLHIYCQHEVGDILKRGLKTEFKEQFCHPRYRKILLRLIARGGPIRITIVKHDDEKPLRRYWWKVNDDLCRNMEHMYWTQWREAPPIEWQGGQKGMTQRGRLTTSSGKVVR